MRLGGAGRAVDVRFGRLVVVLCPCGKLLQRVCRSIVVFVGEWVRLVVSLTVVDVFHLDG